MLSPTALASRTKAEANFKISHQKVFKYKRSNMQSIRAVPISLLFYKSSYRSPAFPTRV